MNKLNIVIVVICSALVAGCAAVAPLTSASLDSDAKKFQTELGKANIYINRKGDYIGRVYVVQIALDGRIAGALSSATYLLFSVPPGEHVLTTTGPFDNIEQIKINAAEGNQYFFDIKIRWYAGATGLPHVILRQTAVEEGLKDVQASERAEAIAY